MSDNKTKILEEISNWGGQFVLCDFKVWRLIGIAQDEWDYYYALYDGRNLHLHTILSRITPLAYVIDDTHYNEMVRIARLNHFDHIKEYVEEHRKEVVGDADFISSLYWNLEEITTQSRRNKTLEGLGI